MRCPWRIIARALTDPECTAYFGAKKRPPMKGAGPRRFNPAVVRRFVHTKIAVKLTNIAPAAIITAGA